MVKLFLFVKKKSKNREKKSQHFPPPLPTTNEALKKADKKRILQAAAWGVTDARRRIIIFETESLCRKFSQTAENKQCGLMSSNQRIQFLCAPK